MLVPFAGLQALPAMHRELGADSVVGGKGRPVRRQRARCTQHLCCAHLCVCLHHLSVTCRVRSIGSSGPVVSSAGWRGDGGGGGLSWHQPSACASGYMRYTFTYASLCLPMRFIWTWHIGLLFRACGGEMLRPRLSLALFLDVRLFTSIF